MQASLSRLRRLDAWQAIPLLAAAMEALWVYPWLIWIGGWPVLHWPRLPLGLPASLGLVIAAEVVSRWTLARRWPEALVRLVVLLVLTFLLALVLRLEIGGGYPIWSSSWLVYAKGNLSLIVAGLLFGAFLFWRGITLGREPLSFDELYPRFLFGMISFVVLLIVWAAFSRTGGFSGVVASSGVYVVAYFSLGLLVLALSNLQAISEQMVRHEGTAGLFNRRWLSILLGVVFVIVAVSVAVASAFSFDLLTLLLHPLGILAEWLFIIVLYALAIPLGVIASGLVWVLRFLAHLLVSTPPPQPVTIPDVSDLRKAAEGQHTGGFPPEAAMALKWAVVALIGVVVISVLARALFRYRRGKSEEAQEVSESLWSWEVFKADLRSFVMRLLQRFRRKVAPAQHLPPPASTAVTEEQARLFEIREIYRGVLWEGRKAGYPRRQSETPYEYARKLEGGLGLDSTDLDVITEAYVALRYGSKPTVGAYLERLNRFWRSLRSAMRGGKGDTLSP